MADFGHLLGTLLASLAHARRIADEETTVIAEYYKANPLLEGMSVPRVRVPELALELPVLINSYEEGEEQVPQDDNVVRHALARELRETLKRENIALSGDFYKRFDAAMSCELTMIKPPRAMGGAPLPRESTIRAVDKAFVKAIKAESPEKISPEKARQIAQILRKKASEAALKRQGKPARIEASIITSEVKEHADSANVCRLRVVMKEEGLEWSVGETPEGTISKKLTPE